MINIQRSQDNPILKPDSNSSWEAEAVFNGCPVEYKKKLYLLYRAESLPHYHTDAGAHIRISDIGIAQSSGRNKFRDRQRFIVPSETWEKFGCEDPRVTFFNGKYYIFYTALSQYPFRPEGIRVAVAITKDLKKIRQKHLVTPFNAKAMALFPNKVNGKMCAILTANTDMPPARPAIAFFEKESDMWSEKFWQSWYAALDSHAVPLLRRSDDQVEVGAPPILTSEGWLLIYSYIRNYFSGHRIFGIEAAILDRRDPQKIIARTYTPLLVPEEEYELYGKVPNIVFPSGAFLKGSTLQIYYGAADTVCCVATTNLQRLLKHIISQSERKITLQRSITNPIIVPRIDHPWEAKATFNPAAVYEGKKVHIIYRAMSEEGTSVLGYASSSDGVHIQERDDRPIYVPREDFEKKQNGVGNSSCEDPRATIIGDTLYLCYTAYDGKNPPRVALTSIPLKKFLRKQWHWARAVPISPPGLDNKDACIFPGRVKGKFLIFHRMGDDVDIALVKSLRFDGSTWLEERRWLRPRRWSWDSRKVGVATPPVKTNYGWVLLYHGVSESSGIYRVGAVLLDKADPTRIIGRTEDPIFEPEKPYEKIGQVNNVVFPCGAVLIDQRLYVYYGAGDSVVGVANIAINDLLKVLR